MSLSDYNQQALQDELNFFMVDDEKQMKVKEQKRNVEVKRDSLLEV